MARNVFVGNAQYNQLLIDRGCVRVLAELSIVADRERLVCRIVVIKRQVSVAFVWEPNVSRLS